MADGVMGEIVRNYVNKTEKRYHGRFLTGFSIAVSLRDVDPFPQMQDEWLMV